MRAYDASARACTMQQMFFQTTANICCTLRLVRDLCDTHTHTCLAHTHQQIVAFRARITLVWLGKHTTKHGSDGRHATTPGNATTTCCAHTRNSFVCVVHTRGVIDRSGRTMRYDQSRARARTIAVRIVTVVAYLLSVRE